MIEPEKLTAPMIALTTRETYVSSRSCGESDGGAVASTKNSAVEMHAAAPPPAPLKSATIWGIAVILTLSAEKSPMTVPTAMPIRMIHQPAASMRQIDAAIASSIPTAAYLLPTRAVAGELR